MLGTQPQQLRVNGVKPKLVVLYQNQPAWPLQNDLPAQFTAYAAACSSIWARASLPMTDWKSRTIVGKGCGPIAEPIR